MEELGLYSNALTGAGQGAQVGEGGGVRQQSVHEDRQECWQYSSNLRCASHSLLISHMGSSAMAARDAGAADVCAASLPTHDRGKADTNGLAGLLPCYCGGKQQRWQALTSSQVRAALELWRFVCAACA
jgi:hypothetical protein